MLNSFLVHWTQRFTIVKIFLVKMGQPRGVKFGNIGGIQLKVVHRFNPGWQYLSPMENPFTVGFALRLRRSHSKFLQKWIWTRRGKRELNLISWKHCQSNWDPDDCLDQPGHSSCMISGRCSFQRTLISSLILVCVRAMLASRELLRKAFFPPLNFSLTSAVVSVCACECVGGESDICQAGGVGGLWMLSCFQSLPRFVIKCQGLGMDRGLDS